MTVDHEKAESLRREWSRRMRLYLIEAASRERKAKNGPKKFYATHVAAAREARKDARYWQKKLGELKAAVAA